MNIKIPISIGELIDKITILEIKNSRIKNEEKLLNVRNELKILRSILLENNFHENIENYYQCLYTVNLEIWELEEDIRKFSENLLYDNELIEFSRIAKKIREKNDQRSVIKKEINLKFYSSIVEEKSHNYN
jgi:hypothetical protein